MAQTWDAYETAYKAIRNRMGEFMSALADELGAEAYEDCMGDDYGFCAQFEVNGIKYGAELQLMDAGTSSGDAEPGEMGNLHLSVCRDGGLIVIAWAPHNYTDNCWVSYSDTAELLARVPSTFEARCAANSVREDAEKGAQ